MHSNTNPKPLVCPKCGDKRFFVKEGDTYIVYEVLSDHTIRFLKEIESKEPIDLENLACLGCSWKGSVRKLLKYFIQR